MSEPKGLDTFTEAAIQKWVDQDGGGMILSYHLIVNFVDSDGSDRWHFATAEGQKMTTTMGLLDWAKGVAAYEQTRYLQEREAGEH